MSEVVPEFKCDKISGGLSWTGYLQPAPISFNYKVKIVYRPESYSPKAYVLEPKLFIREGETSIPHVYSGQRPCLYLPGTREWSPLMYISKTIVPWLSLWLFYYEMWHITGEWLGGGVHPTTNKEEDTLEIE